MKRLMARCFLSSAIAAFSAPAMTADFLDTSYHRRPVQNVHIQNNQSVNKNSSAPSEMEVCRSFEVTKVMVQDFLRRAVAVQSLHDYQYGGCSADGQVTFVDGSKATWLIMSSRIGYLTFSDGRAYNLFCRYEICRERIYASYDGVNSDSEDAEKEDRQQQAASRRRAASQSHSRH